MKNHEEHSFELETASKTDVISILNSHKNELSDKAISSLQQMYENSDRKLMSSSDQKKVLRFLSGIDARQSILVLKQKAK